ncbi:hypothetical protein KBX29_08705 [Corynebacterium sp. CCUG 18816]|uniref:hypothetical protein n=1 Tax=Corynebacterium pseudogenitalium TaxID=38303 RepID=UPI002108EABE|nr:hypothetical protein [Corynebacterium pseudogenitalium]MCQ4616903.1 hypothetical protein [Corynebacterium pseudogenitalium]
MGKAVKKDRGPVCSVLLSYDFIIGLITGGATASIPAFFLENRDELQSMFVGISGVGAGIATLILTAMAVLVGVVSPAYAELLGKTKTGVSGVARPFRLVAQISACASASGLVAANLLSLVEPNPWLVWGVTSVPFILILWSVFGCVQVSRQLVYHWENALKADELERRRLAAQKQSSEVVTGANKRNF